MRYENGNPRQGPEESNRRRHADGGQGRPPYDVSTDGQRFLLVEPAEREAARPSILVVENWFAEFRGRQ